MKKVLWLTALAVGAAGLLAAAEHTYAKLGNPHDLMEGAVKPNMDKLAEMRKAGGPKDEGEWKKAAAWASVVGEINQLMLLDGRIKDQVWEDAAVRTVDGSKMAMQAAASQNMESFNKGLDMMSQGCRSCHKVHKPKK